MRLAGVGLRRHALQAHAAHQALHALAIDHVAHTTRTQMFRKLNSALQPNSCTPRWTQFSSYRARRDTAGEHVNETSYDLQRYCRTRYAASYLRANDIGLHIALRVLSAPRRRRLLVFD